MVERGTREGQHVRLDYTFDRLHSVKLQPVYEILVPGRARVAGARPRINGADDEDGRDLRQGVLGQTEGRAHDRQPDGGLGRVCREQWLQCPHVAKR